MKCRSKETENNPEGPSNSEYKGLKKYILQCLYISLTFEINSITDILDIKETQEGNFLGLFPKTLCGIK